MNISKIIAVLVALTFFSGTAAAQECDKLCSNDWWWSASTSEIRNEIAKADVNARDEKGTTALMGAALNGSAESVKLLLDAGADVTARNELGETALIWAARRGSAENVKLLLDAGADVNARDEKGKTTFDYAGRLKGTDTYWMLNDARFK